MMHPTETDRKALVRADSSKDMADAVLYVANATWVTGVILSVDGGVAGQTTACS